MAASGEPRVQVLRYTETNFKLFVEQNWGGSNQNQISVVPAKLDNDFGEIVVIDWALLDDPYGDAIGRLQGHVTRSSYQSGDYWHMDASMLFLNYRFKGSLEVHGVYTPTKPFEWVVAGGTGQFALAQGSVSGKNLKETPTGRVKEASVRVFSSPVVQ